MSIPKHLRDSLDARLPQTKQAAQMSSDKDIVVEARELASAITTHTLDKQERLRDLLNALADEVERARARLNDPCLVAGYHVCGGVHKAGDPWKG